MNAQLITALFEHIANNTPLPNKQTWWLDLYKRQFDYIKELNEQINFPCIFLEYDTNENAPELEHNFTLRVGFRNEFFAKTYLNQVAGNAHINKGGLDFLGIKETLKKVLNNFRGNDYYCQINSDTLDATYAGITIVKLGGQIYQTEC